MSDTQKHTKPNVPNLRFPGFSGEWEKLKVRDFTKVVAGATPPTDKKEYWGGAIRWMNSGELNLKRVYEVQGRITQLGYDKTSTKLIPSHSVLIGLAGQGKTRGTSAMNYVELCTNQSIASILPSDSFYPEFLYQNIESRYKELRDISSGDGGRGGLNLQMIYNLDIPHCSIQEQQKIGDFLYLLDQRIAIQNKIIEDLKLIKNSITRSLLNRHDESGRIVSLGEITEVVSRRNKGREVFPMYSVTNDRGFIPQTEQFEDREMVGEDISAYKIVHNGEIAYNPARINVGSIAQYTGKESCMISSLYICLKVKPGVLSNWLIQVLRCEQMKNYYNLYAEGGVRLYLFYPNFSKIKIYLPTIEQQKRIASVLEAIEAKISLECSILARYQASKQALLMKLFI